MTPEEAVAAVRRTASLLGKTGDPDALRFTVVGDADALPGTIRIVSVTAAGAAIDTLAQVPLSHVPCPNGTAAAMTCASTRPIRAGDGAGVSAVRCATTRPRMRMSSASAVRPPSTSSES